MIITLCNRIDSRLQEEMLSAFRNSGTISVAICRCARRKKLAMMATAGTILPLISKDLHIKRMRYSTARLTVKGTGFPY